MATNSSSNLKWFDFDQRLSQLPGRWSWYLLKQNFQKITKVYPGSMTVGEY